MHPHSQPRQRPAGVQGYIQDPADDFHVPALARLSAPGAVFDPRRSSRPGLANKALPLVPILLHIAAIVTLNQVIYRRIAQALTDWENHRYADAHRASLIVKRFLFEAFDCYVALFYLAFWHLDIMKVRGELQGMFTGDCARRLALEVLLPGLLQRVFAARRRGEVRGLPLVYYLINCQHIHAAKGAPSITPLLLHDSLPRRFCYNGFIHSLVLILCLCSLGLCC